MSHSKKTITRRGFIQTASAAALAGPSVLMACGKPTDPVPPKPKTLKIMQQKHFVPGYDVWFDQLAKDWGSDNNVEVTVDHVSRGNLLENLPSELMAGEGHDLIEWLTPTAQFEDDLHDLKDISVEAESRFGAQIGFQKRTVLNSKTGKYYGFAPGWAPNNGNYRKTLWKAQSMPNGPTTWQELKDTGTLIWNADGIPIWMDMSEELHSTSNLPGLLFGFGASVQDADHNVVINSPEAVAAVEFMKQMYLAAQKPDVDAGGNANPFGNSWSSGRNYQPSLVFNGGTASFMINPISHYRGALRRSDPIATDNFMTKALAGPNNLAASALMPANISFCYVVPSYAATASVDAAKEFLLHLTANYTDAVYNSELYNHPSYPTTAPDHDIWLDDDPFGSTPANKLAVFKDSESWSTNLGYPGTDNPAIAEVFFEFIIPRMFANAVDPAGAAMTPAAAVADAEIKIKTIFTKWRGRGLI